MDCAGWRSVLFPFQATALRVRRFCSDSRGRKSCGVGPCPVVVPVDEVDGPVRHHGVQQFTCGSAAGEEVHGPSSAQDPGFVRVFLRVAGNTCHHLFCAGGLCQVTLKQLDPGEDGVDVGVLETGHHQLTLQVHPAGLRRDGSVDVLGCSDRDDPAFGYCQVCAEGSGVVAGVYPSVLKQNLCVHGGVLSWEIQLCETHYEPDHIKVNSVDINDDKDFDWTLKGGGHESCRLIFNRGSHGRRTFDGAASTVDGPPYAPGPRHHH